MEDFSSLKFSTFHTLKLAFSENRDFRYYPLAAKIAQNSAPNKIKTKSPYLKSILSPYTRKSHLYIGYNKFSKSSSFFFTPCIYIYIPFQWIFFRVLQHNKRFFGGFSYNFPEISISDVNYKFFYIYHTMIAVLFLNVLVGRILKLVEN